jgi:Bacterial Ig domain/IPT/TIG domain/Purple acid Phosphatase, N-terminal domain/Immunoglobulin I-set domain
MSLSSAALAGCSGLVTANNGGSGSPPPLTISGVQAGTPTTSGVQVSWSTNVAATSWVDYGTTTAYGNSTPVDSAMVTSHQVTLSGLAAGTTYYYQVNSTDSKNNHGKSGGHTVKTNGFNIAGAISPATGGNGTTLTLSGAASTTTTADSSGNYAFTGLPNGTYTIVPSRAGYTFTPSSQSSTVNGTNVTGVNFTDNVAAVAPTITTQPANQTVTAGQTATFTVTATGTAPLAYQWQKNGANIAGATAASYTAPATTTADSGSTFAVVVSNTAGTVTSAAATLTVNPALAVPSITSLNPTSGPVGTSVTIAGTNFGATQGTSTITFNGTAATATSWSATSITAAVPSGATTGNVVVTVGGVASNGVSFTVPVPAPSITSLNPTSGLVGASVSIAGANFGATQGTSKVTFNGTTATATSWSAASVTAAVPSGATTGNVVVTVGGVASNGVSFTVQVDTTPPTVPAGLTATAVSSSQINLAWTASTDNVGVTGYNIFRGGVKIGTAPSTSYQDAGLAASTSYTYNVSAFDAAGNTSAQSTAASATTQAATSGGGIPSALGWYQIPNTSIQSLCPPYSEIQGQSGCKAVMSAWSGGLFDTKRNRLIIHGGGHTDYFGNEIYAIDLNANPISPVLVQDASHGSAISNVTTCPEAYLDGTPSARHSYNGEVYVASQDTYFTFSGSKSNCGFFSSGAWKYTPSTSIWTQQSTSGAAPNPGANGSVPTIAYDPTTGNVFEAETNAGVFWKYDPTAVAWTNLANIHTCTALNMTAAIDDGRRLYFCIGNGVFGKVSLSAPYSSTALTGTGCSALVSSSGPGFAYDPVQKLMVGWAGGNTAYLYNPDTDSCSAVTYSGGPTVIQSNGTYGRFNYSPTLGVFVVANSIDTNAYSLRLTPSGGTGGGGPVISSVSVGSITTTAATVTWTTDVAATSQVEYGTTTSYGTLTAVDANLLTSHVMPLTGLSTNTLYHYRVHSKNASGIESISGDFAFQTSNVIDTTPPTISITAPGNGATVSGTVTVSANATDNVGVTGVQFFLDGANLGLQLVSAPYSVSWDSTSTTNGVHTLTAQARDAAGNVGNAVAVSVTVSNTTSTALQDFQTRCAQTGVIVCQGFDDPAVFTPARYPASGLYPDANGNYLGTFDSTVAASGAGSLKFTVPSQASANSSGYWRQLFSSNLSAGPTSATMFAQNSTFYVQFRQRFSPEYLSNQWPANGGGTTYWKQEIISNDNSTCGNVELTTVNDNNEGYPLMYSACGADVFQVSIGNSDYLNEQGDTSTTGYNCHYQTVYNTPTSCFNYPANTWVTFYYKVSIGTWGQPNSTIQAWVSVAGGPYKEWVNITNHILREDTAGADYDMVTLLTYMTSRNSSVSAGPTAYTWYDELIVSSQPIAAPNN